MREAFDYEREAAGIRVQMATAADAKRTQDDAAKRAQAEVEYRAALRDHLRFVDDYNAERGRWQLSLWDNDSTRFMAYYPEMQASARKVQELKRAAEPAYELIVVPAPRPPQRVEPPTTPAPKTWVAKPGAFLEAMAKPLKDADALEPIRFDPEQVQVVQRKKPGPKLGWKKRKLEEEAAKAADALAAGVVAPAAPDGDAAAADVLAPSAGAGADAGPGRVVKRSRRN
jgi:hypothetical protein